MHRLIDYHGRIFSYLRLSITDVCNFKCSYCLPFGYLKENKDFLSLSEISYLLNAFVFLGIKKIRITGGEPTLRKDLFKLIKIISNYPSIECCALTTNGHNLTNIIIECYKSGLNAINISLDTLDSYKFGIIIGKKKYYNNIINGIYKCLDLGLKTKINVVLLPSFSLKDFFRYLIFIKDKNITVRFIELMKTSDNQDFFFNNYFHTKFFYNYLIKNNWKQIKKKKISGPAIEFENNLYKGKIGFILAYSNNFCDSCNRIRISSFGEIYLCLFGNEYGNIYSLRSLLNNKNDKVRLINFIKKKIIIRSKINMFNTSNLKIIDNLSIIGG